MPVVPESTVENYLDLFGFLPGAINHRISLADAAGCTDSIRAIEQWRAGLIHDNPLDRKTQQLVHWAMTLALSDNGPALIHARALLHAGASLRELYGVCMTAAIVFGMPGYGRSIRIVQDLLEADRKFLAESGQRVGLLDSTELNAMMPSSSPRVHLVDVRGEDEFKTGHLIGARNMPLDQIEFWSPDLPAGGHLIFVCLKGKRSATAQSVLAAKGRMSSTLAGGIEAWQEAGLTLTSPF